ncbi:MAG: chemotaxis protein CheW [Thermodesulfobacteriota bacterium]
MPSLQLVPFFLDGHCYALHLGVVVRVIPAVEITPVPKAPEIVLGLINIRGKIIPAFNLRRRFRLPDRETELTDHFIIANTSKRLVALPADSVGGVMQVSDAQITEPMDILPELEYVAGVVKLKDGLLLIHDLESFLSVDEETALDEVLSEQVEK